ncbi:hypothetical protein LG634_13855 [Streptomyces bambusae]|uniref:hypothetical protein n=1 Tax=Streptomyces bambusae TaxID=1550616 RepID=UPI001CFC700A|nr:hypothetical protein [Streptomyces bambusae]MCB5165916.1 hypothetical protein [Streptomyces bambusae]
MPAPERAEVPAAPAAPPVRPAAGPSGLAGLSAVSVRDLLASCAAATAVSTPPRAAARTLPAEDGTPGAEAA